jgi:membrane-bound serine protease (ClpP class)
MIMNIALIVFALFLYMLCAVVMVLEIFIPSFGLLTLLAVGAFTWATVLLFQMSSTAGWIGLVAATFIIPAFWILTYKLFPNSSIGRAMFLRTCPRSRGDAIADRERLQQLLGKTGKAIGPLRPVGICKIDGLRVSCSAEVGFVPKGATVQVVRIHDNTITVRLKETKN